MRRSASLLLAAISLMGAAQRAHAETRPRYGGALTVEIHDAITLTDPGEWPAPLVPLVYDRLVRLDDRGEPRPSLAASWQHDAENKRWEFRLRNNARFHDGSPITAAAVAAILKGWANVAISGENLLIIQSDSPAPDLAV